MSRSYPKGTIMTKHRKSIIAQIVILFGAIIAMTFLGGCGSAEAPNANTKEVAMDKASLVGTWTADGFVAEVADNSIEINIVSTDSKSLYWKGTFPVADADKVVSKADTEALSMSMLGSQDAEKTFTVLSNDEIDFEMSMMGTTRIVHLRR